MFLLLHCTFMSYCNRYKGHSGKKHQELSKYKLQLHALTGADCISALFKVGKKRALNTLTYPLQVGGPSGSRGKEEYACCDSACRTSLHIFLLGSYQTSLIYS